MDRIVLEADKLLPRTEPYAGRVINAHASRRAARSLADGLDVPATACFTGSGRTA
jgi:hypothetical protein